MLRTNKLQRYIRGTIATLTSIFIVLASLNNFMPAAAAALQLNYNGQALANNSAVNNPLTITLTGDGVTAGKFYADNVYYTKITSATPTFTYPAFTLGTHKIKVVPILGSTNLDGIEVTVTVTDQVIPPPAPTPVPDPTPAPDPTPDPTPDPAPPANTPVCIPPASVVTQGGNRQISVSNSTALKAALADARAGDTITLADGVYESSTQFGAYYASFGLNRSGTSTAPITVQGSAAAKISGRGTGGRYGFELYGTKYVVLKNFTVFDASKGIMLDGSSNNIIDGVNVQGIGAEGIHFRAMSSDNILRNSNISDTGMDKQNFGEGIYIGSAGDANWRVTNCDMPDTSDRNQILNNTVLRARAESVDIKEGASSTIVRGNTFIGDQTAIPAAPFGDNGGDSWIDVKGNYSIIENNTGTNSLNHGFETHSPLVSWYKTHTETPRVLWGAYNVFRNNTANVNNAAAASNPEYTGGYGFSVVNTIFSNGWNDLHNTVMCNNIITGAAQGFSNIPCTP